MKQHYILLLLGVLFFNTYSNAIFAQTDPAFFVTTWKTDNNGSSNSTSITIPTTGSGYDFDIDWDGDGVFEDSNVTGDITHDYGVAGTYTVQIRGDFPRIYFNEEGDMEKILTIEQWGTISWTSMNNAFKGCSNLTYNAIDAPDLSLVSDLSAMFFRASSFNGDISSWDVSNVTNMYGMFWDAVAFNQDLNSWDVSGVTQMSTMFIGASSFNGDISSWNVSLVENMSAMFQNAVVFNQDISGWNVTNVTNMSTMFGGAQAFDQDISGWDVSSVTDMENMFNVAGLSTANYDALLQSWASLTLQSDVDFNAGSSIYCLEETSRQFIVDNFNWTITDGGTCAPDLNEDGNIDGAFVTTWQTDNPGTSDNTSITIPTAAANGWIYDYHVDWDGDGIIDEFGLTGDASHDYGTSGTYKVQIIGTFPRIRFNDEGDAQKIIDVLQWGDIQWDSFSSAFQGCSNLNFTATDTPDLSQVTSMYQMFDDATSFNSLYRELGRFQCAEYGLYVFWGEFFQ